MNASATGVLIIAKMVWLWLKPSGAIEIFEVDQFVGCSQGEATIKEPP
jgi:hypothetical protein